MATMRESDGFLRSAQSLARNPLGIIALFIVLVYAVASIVITFARPEFYANQHHPAVLFLAIFPALVLFVFAYLVAKHHRNLYAPNDFKDTKEFFHGMAVPLALHAGETAAATSDPSRSSIPQEAIRSIEEKYKRLLDGGFALLHHAEVLQPRTSPRSGRYRVRVWIEAIGSQPSIGDIESVTYHVWNDFERPILSTSKASSNFDLWLNIYGEFPVLALIRLRSGVEVDVNRFLDLPGRPPD